MKVITLINLLKQANLYDNVEIAVTDEETISKYYGVVIRVKPYPLERIVSVECESYRRIGGIMCPENH